MHPGKTTRSRLGVASAVMAAGGALLLVGHCDAALTTLAPIGQAAAAATTTALGWLGVEVARSGSTLLHESGFRTTVDIACTGLPLMALIATALLATPTAWSRRRLALAVALPLLVGVHGLRLVHLVHLGITAPLAFDFAHDIVWPVTLIALCGAAWAFWREHSPPEDLRTPGRLHA